MTYRRRNILMASGLAVLAAAFMLIYVSKARNEGELGSNLVTVLVAGRNIDEGTPGSALAGKTLIEKRIPRRARVPGAVTSPTEVRRLVATEETLSGEQVTLRRFGPLAATGVRSRVRARQRVFQVAGDAHQVLDGTLKAGDHVDVIGAWSVPPSCSTCRVALTIVLNALVLGTSVDLPSTGTAGSNTTKPVQLRLTDREAERVFWVVNNGDWWLALRPVVKPRSSRPGVQHALSILRARGR